MDKDLANNWWRDGVIYQVYPKSFADSNNDGIGDLRGIISKLPALAELGVDAIWLSPIFPSPQKDAGYDVSDYLDIDPVFGTLSDFDALLETAHGLGLKLMLDLVPNHTSSEHVWFQKALADSKSKYRNYYHFVSQDSVPNNWQSMFGGSAWTKTDSGDWYLHLFDSTQPDLNWNNPEVRAEFEAILRFWLDRGVDGFRVDQPHAMVKSDGYPDHPYVEKAGAGFIEGEPDPPMWFQDGVHEIFRSWRKILDSYPNRAMCGEAFVLPLEKMALWVRPDEFHQTFNFRFLDAGWDAALVKASIDESFEAFGAVSAPATWVLNNHDVVRTASRFGGDYGRASASDGIGPNDPQPDSELGHKRAVAAAMFMLGLPGSAYLYQGEELGLPDHTEIDPSDRQDPTFFRTGGKRVGRDGARVPLPWEGRGLTSGFSNGNSWLPQPQSYKALIRKNNPTLDTYSNALGLRKKFKLGSGEFSWLETSSVLAYRNNQIDVFCNFGNEAVDIPAGRVILDSTPKLPAERQKGSIQLLPDQCLWLNP